MADTVIQLLQLGGLVAFLGFAILLTIGFGLTASWAEKRTGPISLDSISHQRMIGGAGGLLAALAVLAVIWSPVLTASAPPALRAFGPVTGEGPAFMGIDVNGQAIFAKRSGALIEYSFNLGNFGNSEVTVTGLESPAFFELEQVGSGLVPASQASAVAVGPKLRNVEFSIPPGGHVRVTLIARVIDCPATSSVETLGPGMSPSSSMADDLESRSNNFFGPMPLQLGYQDADGSSRVMTLELPSTLLMSGFDASSCQGPMPLPS
jgi:hypothetical protein